MSRFARVDEGEARRRRAFLGRAVELPAAARRQGRVLGPAHHQQRGEGDLDHQLGVDPVGLPDRRARVGILPVVARYADVLQIGARNMQNFKLLKATAT